MNKTVIVMAASAALFLIGCSTPTSDSQTKPAESFSVTFASNGGSAVAGISGIQNGAKIVEPANPGKEGFAFAGWYKEDSLENPWNFDTDVVTQNIVLYAKWASLVPADTTPPGEVADFAADAGNTQAILSWVDPGDADFVGVEISGSPGIETSTIAKGSLTKTFTGLSNGVLYTFIAKTIDASGNKSSGTTISTTPEEPAVYCTVSYNAAGGTGSIAPSTIEAGSSVILNDGSGIAKEGYSFAGWKAGNAGETIAAGVSFTVRETAEMYAQWTINTYTVTFVYNNGSASTTASATYGGKIDLPAPSLANHAFRGWWTQATGGAQFTADSVVTADITVYAQWTENEPEICTVSYNANGGSGTIEPAAVEAGSSVILSDGSGIAKEGYTFAGWKAGNEGESIAPGGSYTVRANVEMFAQWTLNSYTVTFVYNNGAANTTGIVAHGGKPDLPAPSLAHYDFGGWWTQSTGGERFASDSVVTSNITLYARWTIQKHRVAFMNGAVEYTAIQADYGASLGASMPAAPTKAGYAFAGWWTEELGLGSEFSGTTVLTADLPVYAKWTPINVSSISLDRSVLMLEPGSSGKLISTVLPEGALDKSVIWESSDNLIAEVDGEGTITLKAEGKAVISAKTVDGGLTATCRVSSPVITTLPAPNGHFRATSAVVGGDLYVFGGYWVSNKTWKYTPSTNTWTEKAAFQTGREELASAVIGGKIYVAGGAEYSGANSTLLDCYDPAADAWESKAPMPVGQKRFTLSEAGGKLYAIGGDASVLCYDPASNAWTAKTPMPTTRACHSAAVLNGKIYVTGGVFGNTSSLSSLQRVDCYDPEADVWTTRAPMAFGRYEHDSTVYDGKLYVFGGNSSLAGYAYPAEIECYDPGTNSWTTLSPMSTGRIGLCTEALNGKIYAVGGTSRGWSDIQANLDVYNPEVEP